jgi:hypothetical protein
MITIMIMVVVVINLAGVGNVLVNYDRRFGRCSGGRGLEAVPAGVWDRIR